MCNAFIVYNGFWNPDFPPDVILRLVQAAKSHGLNLLPVANNRLTACCNGGVNVIGLPADCRFGLFWDKDIRLARALEASGIRLYNRAEAVAVCDDKSATHLALSRLGIAMPLTLTAPMTYTEMDINQSGEFLQRAADTLGFPMVVKECYGSMGGQVYLAEDMRALKQIAASMRAKPFICQKYIAASHGTDIRIYVTDGCVTAAMRRTARDGDFRSNIELGGTVESYTPTEKQACIAIKCCAALGLLFGGVDLLDNGHDDTLVCEVNASAWMKAIEHSTGKDVAGAVIEAVMRAENLLPSLN